MKLLNVKSVDEVKKVINNNFQCIGRTEYLPLWDCLFRVLAEDIFSPETLPPFSRSSVDGYAVKASDTYGASDSLPAFLNFTGEIKMGKSAGKINPGETKYIPTGGMLPQGADAVIMVEYTEKVDKQVYIYNQIAPGENVIKAGDDVKAGELVLPKGTVLKEAELGSLAALGINKVPVYGKPVVGIISTGNELVSFDTEKLENGQIRDINSIILSAMAQKFGAQVILGGIRSDDFNSILSGAQNLLSQVDILLLSGGSSVGTLDFTAQVLRELSDEILVEGIAVKPGKPTILAKKGNKAIWGLPGHPVSCMMIFGYFGEILMDVLKGNREMKIKKTCKGILTRNIPSSAGRTELVRVRVEQAQEGLKVTPVFGKSGLITTLIGTQGFIEIPPFKEGLENGSIVEVVLWN
ncbi:MAG: molybdopterin molybdotransferase MoeA [Clostridia bacterium]|nr:molybdopterin molybdotransferase MoeA [Clostridia bacterium]